MTSDFFLCQAFFRPDFHRVSSLRLGEPSRWTDKVRAGSLSTTVSQFTHIHSGEHANASLCRFSISRLATLARAEAASAVTIPTVPVGDAGNATDPLTGNRHGSVSYDYRIGTTEVTNAQYAEFFNAKAASDPLALYNTNMGSDARGGITRSGSGTIPDPYVYTTKTEHGRQAGELRELVRLDPLCQLAATTGRATGDTETGRIHAVGRDAHAQQRLEHHAATRVPPGSCPAKTNGTRRPIISPPRKAATADDYWLYPTASNSAPTIATANSVGDISNPGITSPTTFWRRLEQPGRQRDDGGQRRTFKRELLRHSGPGRQCVGVERSLDQRIVSGLPGWFVR